MDGLWKWLLGLEDGELPPGRDAFWEFADMPSPGLFFFTVLLVAACVVFIFLLYRNERSLSGSQKIVLTLFRISALAIIVLVLLNPRVITEIQLTRSGRALVFFDVSKSMGQRDDYESEELARLSAASGLDFAARPTRTELAAAVFEKQGLIPGLAERNQVEIFGVDAETHPLEKADVAEYVAPHGEESRIGDAISRHFQDVGRDPIAGVILLSDGRVTSGKSLRAAGRQIAAQHHVPVHAVGVGRLQLPKNYAVQDLRAAGSVEVGYPVQIDGKVILSGIRGPVEVTLVRETKGGGARKIIGRRRIEPRNRYFESRLKFIDTLDRRGVYRYRLSIPIHDTELHKTDNHKDVFVRASEQEYRVLLVSGSGTPEYRFLCDFAIRDDSVLVSSWQSSADERFTQEGNVRIRSLPQSARELNEYEVIVLIDPDPDVLTESFQRALREFVSIQGGGLLFVSGEINTRDISTEPAYSGLRRLLPVDLGASTRTPTIYSDAWRPQLTATGYDHPLCRVLEDQDENLRLWARMPEFFYFHTGARLKPAASALMVRGELPVAAFQRVGLGETVYFGCDEFWRWRSPGVAYYERYWSTIVRYLAMGKKLAGTRQVTVETDRDIYRLDETVRITVQLVNSKDRAEARSSVVTRVLRIKSPDRKFSSKTSSAGVRETRKKETGKKEWILKLPANASQPGQFSGLFRPTQAGHYRVEYTPESEARFEVRGHSAEWEDPSPDFTGLEELAEETGGEFLALEDIGSLPELIPETKITEILGRRAASVWDSSALMILFCILLAIEWSLRKLWRLN